MIDTVDELKIGQKVYIGDFSMFNNDKIHFAVYSLKKIERKGVGKSFVEFTTNAKNDRFRKTVRCVTQYSIVFPNSDWKPYDNLKELQQDYCRMVKRNPEKNPKLTKKLTAQFPQYFI